MAIEFSRVTLQKEGVLQSGDVTYNVNTTAVNNELTRLYCGITKKLLGDQPDDNGVQIQIGHITLEHGRQVTEITQGENLIPHITKFQEILDEVLGKTSEPTTPKNTIKK